MGKKFLIRNDEDKLVGAIAAIQGSDPEKVREQMRLREGPVNADKPPIRGQDESIEDFNLKLMLFAQSHPGYRAVPKRKKTDIHNSIPAPAPIAQAPMQAPIAPTQSKTGLSEGDRRILASVAAVSKTPRRKGWNFDAKEFENFVTDQHNQGSLKSRKELMDIYLEILERAV